MTAGQNTIGTAKAHNETTSPGGDLASSVVPQEEQPNDYRGAGDDLRHHVSKPSLEGCQAAVSIAIGS